MCVTSNDGSSSNSTSATSGAPEPAFSASVIFTYSGSPAPTSSWVTQMDGWVLLNSVTARPIPGTQAQNVTFVADEFLQEAPASTRGAGARARRWRWTSRRQPGAPLLPPHAASRRERRSSGQAGRRAPVRYVVSPGGGAS